MQTRMVREGFLEGLVKGDLRLVKVGRGGCKETIPGRWKIV